MHLLWNRDLKLKLMIHLCKSTSPNSFELTLIYSFLDSGVARSPKRRNIVPLVFICL